MDAGCADIYLLNYSHYSPVSITKIRMNYQSYHTFPMETAVISDRAVETLLCSLIWTFVSTFFIYVSYWFYV